MPIPKAFVAAMTGFVSKIWSCMNRGGCKDKSSSEVSFMSMYTREIKRGDIFYADLSPAIGSEQGGTRPVLIVQNDVGNYHSPTVIVAILTSKSKKKLPTHISIHSGEGNITMDSTVLLEQIRTIDKFRLQKYVGSVSDDTMDRVDRAMLISLGLSNSA